MREILFRGKRKDNGEWVEGDMYRRTDVFGQRETIIFQDKGANMFRKCFVDPETACQYTGLTDKNGKKIFEGDIVVCKKYIGGNFVDYSCEIGYVEMKHGAFGLHRKFCGIDAYYRPFKDWFEDYEYEVIGNVFDNPDLITTKKGAGA